MSKQPERSITGDDWKRSLAKSRIRRQSHRARVSASLAAYLSDNKQQTEPTKT